MKPHMLGNSLKPKKESVFPNLVDEARKYGLSESQVSTLVKYLNDKRMLRIISLESFNRNARAWLSALTGIVAEVLAMDAHATIWLDKKLEKPRNWILSKINAVVPTKIDDFAVKAINTAQSWYDNKLLPAKEKILSDVSSKMHDKYEYHNNANYLGNTMQELKGIAKNIAKESKAKATDALNTLKDRKLQATLLHGKYKDDDGYWHNTSRFQTRENNMYLKHLNERKHNEKLQEKKENNNTKENLP